MVEGKVDDSGRKQLRVAKSGKKRTSGGAGKHLAEHCRSEYPRPVTLLLWVVAELAIVASDIPEGTHRPPVRSVPV